MNTVDIAENDQLLELYGVKIPVLKRLDTGVELAWPFGEDVLSKFFS